ncbi:MAG: holo-ACP synthase [Faecalibacterium sp.]
MIVGIGCDLCAIARMEKIMQKPNAAHFLRRVFAPQELALLGIAPCAGADAAQTASSLQTEPAPQLLSSSRQTDDLPCAVCEGNFSTVGAKVVESLAANFAAKEAFLKATGTGLAGFSLADIAALRHPNGAPYYQFTGSAAAYMAEHGYTAHLSLSHEKGAAGMAMAYCVLEQR